MDEYYVVKHLCKNGENIIKLDMLLVYDEMMDFWHDVWVGDHSLFSSYHKIYDLDWDKEMLDRYCAAYGWSVSSLRRRP